MIKKVLITGGAGFVGSSLAIRLKGYFDDIDVVAFDNLKRRGSELTLQRIREAGVRFVHGDLRNRSDLLDVGPADLVIDCAAEPSVLAGVHGAPDYVIDTNLGGTINLLEFCRQHSSRLFFLSTSRVYPYEALNAIAYDESETRFEYRKGCEGIGFSTKGISEDFPLNGPRTLYGSTKLCSEHLIEEYRAAYGLQAVVNRCGVLAGPWQMGKVDQGFVALWVSRHLYNLPLSLIGFGGSGKQVRDVLHIDDLFDLLVLQLKDLGAAARGVWNVGGGVEVSTSLRELTDWCVQITGQKTTVTPQREDRPGDVAIYCTDATRVRAAFNWAPRRDLPTLVSAVNDWIVSNREMLRPVFTS